MRLWISKNKYVFLLLSAVTVLLGFFSGFFLPERFFYDALTIAKDPYDEKGFWGSYPVSMSFYHYTLLGKLPFPVVGLIQLPLLLFILYRLGVSEQFHKFTLRNVLAYISILLLAFFISMPSKEFITFCLIAYAPFLIRSRRHSLSKTLALIFSGLILFGLWFRPYFALIPILAISIQFISTIKIKNRIFSGIASGLLVAIFLSLSYGFIKGEYFSESTREELNLFRKGSEDAESMITSPVSTETWYGEAVGIVYGFFSVNFPVTELKHVLKPQVLAFIIWQLLLFIYLLYLFQRCLKNRQSYRYELWIFNLVFSYFIIQGVFEPDLGSAVRHKIGILPWIYFALYYDHFRKQI